MKVRFLLPQQKYLGLEFCYSSSMNLKDTYNKIAEDWHKDHHQDDWWHKGTNKFASFLSPGAHIIDVGCGAGNKAKYLTERGLKVTGVGFSEKLLEIARREVPNAIFILSDMRDLSIIEGHVDAIFSQASLLHIPKKEAPDVISHWVEKLKPGGYLYIAVKGAKEGQPEEQTIREDDYGYEYERFFSFYSLQELKKYLADLGVSIEYENENLTGNTNWIQVIGRKI